MTKHADRKAAARAYAAEHGVTYSEARRALGYDENGTNKPRIVGPRIRVVGHAPHPITGEPTPVRVDVWGNVLDQHIWRGRLYSLLGFHSTPVTTYAPQIPWGQYLFWSGDDDDLARGKHPIVAPRPCVYEDPRLAPAAKWDLAALPAVERIESEPLPLRAPVEATVTSEEQDAPDLEFGYTFDVSDWLPSLSDEEIRIARVDGWRSPVLARFVIDEAHWAAGIVGRKGAPLPVPVVLQAWADHTEGLMESNAVLDWLRDSDPDNAAFIEARITYTGTLVYPWWVEINPETAEAFFAQWEGRMTPDHMLTNYDPMLPGGRPQAAAQADA